MDERHWWIASKIQQSFHSEGLDSSYGNFIEDFLSDPNIVENISEFLAGAESNTLIFYSQKKNEASPDAENKIQIASSASKLKELLLEDTVSVAFVRTSTGREIEPVNVEKEIFFLELKQNALSVYADLLSHAFMPLLKAQKEWGECNKTEVTDFLISFEKHAFTLQDFSSTVNVVNYVLKRPDMDIAADFKHSRHLAVNSVVVAQCENLVQDWMQTIESLLSESLEDRYEVCCL